MNNSPAKSGNGPVNLSRLSYHHIDWIIIRVSGLGIMFASGPHLHKSLYSLPAIDTSSNFQFITTTLIGATLFEFPKRRLIPLLSMVIFLVFI